MKQTTSMSAVAIKVSVVSILVNIVLSAFKLMAGLLANSGAMVSDAVHSLSDVFSTFIVIGGVKIAGRKSDANHPYGHERFESVAAILLAVLLFAVGAGIGYSGIRKIIYGSGAGLVVPGTLALVAALISIAAKEAMYWYTRNAAKKVNSGALMADAWHHRSDAMSSVGSFVGILGARLGFPVLDPLASVVICLFIIKVAFDIFKDAVAKMTDEACDDETMTRIETVIEVQPGVVNVDMVRSRRFGNKIYVDVEIAVRGDMPLVEAHAIAQAVHDAIEKAFPDVKHCMVHVNPS